MAKVQCEYCGHFINDTEDTCPKCGAANINHQRTASDTPQTIEQLQSWYRARNLPPEHVTRFFIGKDIKEPRAFGIYENAGEFIVYKNKSDGSRAIRYQGTDEAYAVNELYLRLKEEILKQKSMNINKNSSRNTNYNNKSTNRRTQTSRYTQTKKSSAKPIVIVLVVILLTMIIPIIGFFAIVGSIMSDFNDISSYTYYYTDTGDIYYNEGYSNGGYEWWKYDLDTKTWSYYATYDDSEMTPNGVDVDDAYRWADDLAEVLGIEYKDINIYDSKEYIDAGHHFTPSTSYYYHNDTLYYFLDDSYSGYGTTDNSGWYRYNNDTWEYFCDEDDKDLIGEDLYYYEDDYRIYDIEHPEYYIDNVPVDWNPIGFETTSWYESYQSNKSAYDQYWEDYKDNYDDDDYDWDWDYDSDYDWDDDYDWDSDWDSDWGSDW